jgi:hypothetical protein
MNPETLRFISAFLTLVGFLVLLRQLYWQFRLGPNDHQKRSAVLVVLSTEIIMGQLCFAYFGGPALGTSWRGPVSYAFWIITLVYWWWWTEKWNRDALRISDDG